MRTFSNLGAIIRAGSALVLVLGVALGTPSRAQASILAGCVGTDDTAVPGVVGWVDVGVMLGTADPEPPTSMRVIAPDGTEVEYANGIGLTPPTEFMPIWFAPAPIPGEYRLVVNQGEECVAGVDAGDTTAIIGEELTHQWIALSAPVKRHGSLK